MSTSAICRGVVSGVRGRHPGRRLLARPPRVTAAPPLGSCRQATWFLARRGPGEASTGRMRSRRPGIQRRLPLWRAGTRGLWRQGVGSGPYSSATTCGHVCCPQQAGTRSQVQACIWPANERRPGSAQSSCCTRAHMRRPASPCHQSAPNFSGVVQTRSAPSRSRASASLSPLSSTTLKPSGPNRSDQSWCRSCTSALQGSGGQRGAQPRRSVCVSQQAYGILAHVRMMTHPGCVGHVCCAPSPTAGQCT